MRNPDPYNISVKPTKLRNLLDVELKMHWYLVREKQLYVSDILETVAEIFS